MPVNISIIHGPNLNMLGKREKSIYGSLTLDEINQTILTKFDKLASIDIFQSNHEGQLIEYIQKLDAQKTKGIVINAAALTHSSVGIRDALLSVSIPFIEVHLSNVYKREDFRKISFLSDCAVGVISGLGPKVYSFAIDYFIHDFT
ncbi:MAG: type II 3-dehydroquinate dehydratase [Spirochaetia bacterium]|nr:type II 3-dehydroquinate dehydratase [Spirochaetia bacterium]